MPTPRIYENQAARQKAYRARRAAKESPDMLDGIPGYAKWRKVTHEARVLLSATYDELDEWMKDRSERWQESDRAGELAADRDKLWEIIDSLEDLSIGG